MNRNLNAILLGALLFGASAASAADKVGYVDMARILNEVNEGKAAKAKLKRDFDKKQTKLDRLQNDLKAKKEDFDKRRAMMKPEIRAQKEQELQQKFMELQQTYMQLQQELIGEETKITQNIAKKIKDIVGRIGDRDGYGMIVDIGDTVLYYKRNQDITPEVVREYNKQYSKK